MLKPLVTPYSIVLERNGKRVHVTAINVDQADRAEFERRMSVKFCNYDKVEVK
jgi:hypothetical protein